MAGLASPIVAFEFAAAVDLLKGLDNAFLQIAIVQHRLGREAFFGSYVVHLALFSYT